MDWTGGTRRRYAQKGRGNAILRKQKAHFAKVRAGEHPTLTGGLHDAFAAGRSRPPMLGINDYDGQQINRDDSRSRTFGDARRNAVDANNARSQRSHESTSYQPREATYHRSRTAEYGQYLSGNHDESGHMSTRQRLLARSDWLGLRITRPVQMKFPFNRETERRGKRRKVERQQALNAMPAEADIFQPAAALPRLEPRINDALIDDDIHVRIGTDAFASQTQRSRPSRAHLQTSIAPPSTAISEESMLLPADSDEIETQSEVRNGFLQLPLMTGDVLQNLTADERQLREDIDGVAYPQYQQGQLHQHELSEASFETLTAATDEGDGYAGETVEANQARPPGIELLPISRDEPSSISAAVHAICDSAIHGINERSDIEQKHHDILENRDECGAQDLDDDVDDEATWKELMHIGQSELSHESMIAVRSSSPHVTQPITTSSCLKETLLPSLARNENHELLIQGLPDVANRQRTGSQNVPKPTVEQADRAPLDSNEEDSETEENDLWRQFVLGGCNTQQEESSLAGTRLRQSTSLIEGISPLSHSSSPSGHDQVRSDHATTGGSVFAVEPCTNGAMHNSSHNSLTDLLSQDDANTSMVGHATTAGPWLEDIDDEDDPVTLSRSYPRPSRPAGSKLDPKRFKQARKRAPYPPLPRVVPRFLPAISTMNTAPSKSPYDLSDGLSF